jgi:hypothetical protein
MRQFKINGQTVIIDPNWNASSRLNQRTTMNMTVIDLQGLESIYEGASVEMYDDTSKLFAGIVYSVRKYEAMPNTLYYDVQAVDNSALADKRIVVGAVENEYAGEIVRTLILPILAEEGVTEGDIQDGALISKAIFNYIKCSEALDQLKDLTGFNWKIDNDRKLNFFSRETNTSPFVLSNTIPHKSFEQNSTMGDYRNRQYVRGSQGETAVQTLEKPSPKPDGQSQNFILRFPLAKKPFIFINSTQVADSDIGVNGLDTGKKWYFSYNSNTITQDHSETPLIATDVLEITYIGLRNLLLMLDNNSGIDDRRDKETGTSGIYESMSNEQTIKSTNQAVQYGQGLIQKYGEISDTINFTTTVAGLEAGQLLTVNKPLFGVNDSFLIESVNMSAWDGGSIEYQVTVLDGASIGGWEQFFKEIIRDNRDFTISEDEVIILIKNISESEKYLGEIEVILFNLLYPSETLYPSDTLYPNGTPTIAKIKD